MRKSDYIENPHMLGENRLPTRSMLLPSQKPGITHQNFTESNRVQLLNGDWKFSYLAADTEEAFYQTACDDSTWDTLEVPSMWQYKGYGACLYPNVRYCFPYDPPYIDRDNPVGLYRYSFDVQKPQAGKVYLRFMGVDNAYFVWLNGEYVGFSKGSRIPAEFDVTEKLLDGENLIAVKVYTFSDASYLENQDMLMASGIFRDVMLVYAADNSLWDYTVLASDTGFDIKYECSTGLHTATVKFTLYEADEKVAARAEGPVCNQGEVSLPVENPIKWNAEVPYLYTLVMMICEGDEPVEIHTKKIGIAKSEVDGYYLKLNGSPIMIKGVNRHENNPYTGRTISTEQIRSELMDIKSCGLNAIRCAHYTNQPVFYELASELGIYVMDEADCESHGAEATGDQGALNKDPEWFDAFFDRTSRMYYLNKNETCINIWSMGNECGYGDNNDRCVQWFSEQDVKKPVKDSGNPEKDSIGQFHMTGYMPMQELYDSKPEDGALMLIEYAHAMGNSPGGLEDIWDWIYRNDYCCGGYVWEFKSHGFYAEGKDGQPRYLYGGDFNDLYHWSNFSLDGYHTSDGTPKPTWDELREVSAPVFVEWMEDGVFVKNTYDFKTLEDITMRWSVKCDGDVVQDGEIPLGAVSARTREFYPLDLDVTGLCGLVTLDCEFYEEDKKLAHKQKVLCEIEKKVDAPKSFTHTVSGDRDCLWVAGDDFEIEFCDGVPAKLVKDGITLFDAPMKLNVWRAPTDNDGIEGLFPRWMGEWKDALVHTTRFAAHNVEYTDAADCVTIKVSGKFLPQSFYWGFDTQLTYTVRDGGETNIAVSMQPYGIKQPEVLPRVGVYFELPEDYMHAEWFGRGPGDSYSDRKASAPIGRYACDIDSLNFMYDVPQETGNHEDCRYVRVTGGKASLGIVGKFAFSCHDFTLENLTEARHYDKLIHTDKKYLYIDHVQRGIGSKSCGPEPEAQYELPMGAFEYTFTIVPGMKDPVF